MGHSDDFKKYVGEHAELLQGEHSNESWHMIPTHRLLLNMQGVEVAARPWLYARNSFGDANIKVGLLALGQIEQRHKPSLKAGLVRKLLSKCVDYEEDFPVVVTSMTSPLPGKSALSAMLLKPRVSLRFRLLRTCKTLTNAGSMKKISWRVCAATTMLYRICS